MLCLDEGTPVVMALCLLGAVLFIVGGSFWGSGDYNDDRQKTVSGIVMFSLSILLLCLAGFGCWCNRFFCTPDRKSRIALKLYGARPSMPPADDLPEDAATTNSNRGDGGSVLAESVTESRAKDPDWEEYAGTSSYRSFRSGRNSTRGKSRRASFRRDKVTPSSSEPGQWHSNGRTQRQKLPTPPDMTPPPLPPHPATDYDITIESNHRMVPVEFALPNQQFMYSNNHQTDQRSHQNIVRPMTSVSPEQDISSTRQPMPYTQQQQQQRLLEFNARSDRRNVEEYQQRSCDSPQYRQTEDSSRYLQQQQQQPRYIQQPLKVTPHISVNNYSSRAGSGDAISQARVIDNDVRVSGAGVGRSTHRPDGSNDSLRIGGSLNT
ncbi:hypothetical protein BOX15_Mlig031590g1 [Macrostomum lignano]|uniref:Uncharacterized protein n=1 Tax=Macrostomum lignano TaxID=282301 RepID=A0A267FCL1_9PLAT|nr:hypothetical protein BOX15_Mlig031590g1 [Macrostomum lignano]